MSTHPIDIIADAIRESRPMAYPSPPKDIAVVAVNALADERITARVGQALAADVASRPDSPLHAANMTVAEYERLARVALRSVGDA